MIITNYDVNGKVIPDLSIIKLPEDFGRFVYQIKLESIRKQDRWFR